MPGACDRGAAPRGGMPRRPRRHRNCGMQYLGLTADDSGAGRMAVSVDEAIAEADDRFDLTTRLAQFAAKAAHVHVH
jgi:hypothetical protein